jgi:hypothetical protein
MTFGLFYFLSLVENILDHEYIGNILLLLFFVSKVRLGLSDQLRTSIVLKR